MNTPFEQELARFVAISGIEFRQFLALTIKAILVVAVIFCIGLFATGWIAVNVMPSTKIGLIIPFGFWILGVYACWKYACRWADRKLAAHALCRKRALDRVLNATISQSTSSQ